MSVLLYLGVVCEAFGTLTAPAPPSGSALTLRLEHGALRLGSGAALLEAIDPSLRASPSPTGGVFLHGDFRSSCAAADVALGSLRCSRVLACARCTRYWMAPAVGVIPHDTQFLLVELGGAADGGATENAAPPSYAVMLPLIDRTARSSLSEPAARHPLWLRRMLRHPRSADRPARPLLLHVETGDEAVMVPAGAGLVYVAAGSDPFELITRGVAEVAERLGTFRTRAQKPLPPACDVFGWCTWDGFYSKVRPADVLAGAASLRKQGVPPRLVILDDGWQSVTPPPPDQLTGPEEQARPSSPPPATPAAQPPGRDAATAAASEEGAAASGGPPPAAAGPPAHPPSPVTDAFVAWSTRVLVPRLEVWYETTVCRSPEGSFPVRFWAWLASGPLRATLQQYFDSKTDFARQLASFRPNAKFELPPGAPAGDAKSDAPAGPRLASLVSALRRDGVRHVYAWHALHGYWRGAAPALAISEGLRVQTVLAKPSRHLRAVEPQLQWDAMVLFGAGLLLDTPDLDAFFARLHAPLAAAGVDGVKVDVQSGLAALGGGVGGPASLARRYVDALEASATKSFGANLIHCMCHSTETLYRYRHGNQIRASDDYYPKRPESHTMHVVNVAYNSLLVGEIGVPDWDMFASLHEAAGLHAAARAVGGCPIYVSDTPGQHDGALLRKLVLPDGATLRANGVGRPTRDCLFADVTADAVSALKLWNSNGRPAADNGGAGDGASACPPNAVLGAFNVQGSRWDFATHGTSVDAQAPPPVSALVRPSDAECLRPHPGPFAVWSHQGARLQLLHGPDACAHATLQHREWELFTIAPVHARGSVQWAPIGLVEMLNSGGAVVWTLLSRGSPDRGVAEARVSSRAAGRFVAYCRPRPKSVWREGAELGLPFAYDGATGVLTVQLDRASAQKPATLVVQW